MSQLDKNSEKGALHILLLLAGVGILAFLGLMAFAPFGNKLFTTLFVRQTTHAATPTDWPQVQKDPQRTGFTSETLGSNFRLKWNYTFAPERVFPQVQAIVYDNKVYVGTEMGNMYALDAVTPETGTKGKVVWKTNVGTPILNSVAADSGKVFFGGLDGAVYALNTATGTQAWKKYVYKGQVVNASPRLGFSTAPILAEGKVMLGSQDGYFYAFDMNNGNLLWAYNAGAPILMTAAYDNGKAFFGSMDMFVHGVNTSNGTGAWKSQKFDAMAFKDYWPVVAKYMENGTQRTVVIIRPMGKYINEGLSPGTPFVWNVDWAWVAKWGPTLAAGNMTSIPDDVINGKSYKSFMTAQNNVMADFQANPTKYKISMQALDVNTGQQSITLPHMPAMSIGGAINPPCIDRDGKLIVSTEFIRAGYGRIDLNSKRYVDILYDGLSYNGQPVSPSNVTPKGMGNSDEDVNVTCTQNQVFMLHQIGNGGANFTGAFNLDTRLWTQINAAGGADMANNTEAGGVAPFSVSNGMIYSIIFHQVAARTTN